MSEQTQIVDTRAILAQDLEYSGKISHAAGEGAKFALLLSMLHPNVMYRPKMEAEQQEVPLSVDIENPYRSSSLSAQPADWQYLNENSLMLSQPGGDANMKLWQAMHPEPLAQFDDVKRIPDDVIYNCELQVQSRLRLPKEARIEDVRIEEDPTGLYDILESLPELVSEQPFVA